MFLFYSTLHSQTNICNKNVEGIFLTYNDFKNGTLTRPTDLQHKNDKIQLRQFFMSPQIVCNEQDTKKVFSKDSIFGIKLSNGQVYRFVDLKPYQIVDSSFLCIYRLQTKQTEYKQSGPHRRAKSTLTNSYFYSYGTHSQVYVLTLENLQKATVLDSITYNIICQKFTTTEALLQTDPATGQFVLNETINQMMKQ
jgi:hypothetical protein